MNIIQIFAASDAKKVSQDRLLQWAHATSYSGRSNGLRQIDVLLQQGP
jgi:hypothetical protein